ncbi:MAG: heme NO-binding domain-containing protein [Deltaproteobacteria bacterium]|nr:heme NO-binding domain-containing protein [Deltaproteobacteria bacterium]
MRGIINKGIEELVLERWGDAAWNEVKRLAGCDEPFFAVSSSYPDETTAALIDAASRVSGLPPESVMIEYGKYVVPHSLKRHYPSFFALAGASPRQFLLNLNRVHREVTKSIRGARPPFFRIDEAEDGRLQIEYGSERRLCAVLHGLLLGVGLALGQELTVRHTECRDRGDPACRFEVLFP